METKFTTSLNEVTEKAKQYINEYIVEGKTIIFLSEKEMEEDEDAFTDYELPIAMHYGKYGSYDEFKIIGVTYSTLEKEVVCLTKATEAESPTQSPLLGLEYLDDSNICDLADFISQNLL